MLVPSAETDFVGDFRRYTYHLLFFLQELRKVTEQDTQNASTE